MKILITGSSKGIGLAVSNYFLSKGFDVIGIDILPSSINNPHYQHFICDISDKNNLPEINDIDYLFNNAGLQNSNDDITNNLVGTINVTKKYGFQKTIKSILFNASASARNGFEFDQYVASKAGVVGYMKHVASLLAKQGVTCNSISLGGVITDSNKEVMDDPKLWKQIMDITPLKKWASLDEICEWVYFLLIINKSMSGQDLLIDNGENDLNNTFVWPKAY
jgi:3-oxoacyl-[acyl-carrier protein] reductase